MSEEKAIALKEPTELRTFEEVKESVQELNKFYTKLMQSGTDYDTIPGTQKPTLLKSGAELLRLRFGFNPHFNINKGLTDVFRGFIEYDIVCSLDKDGQFIADGVGNANSLESKWRYRWVDEKDIPKGTAKEDLVVKWIKTKTGGSYPKYRMDNENPQDQANTILKIAKKRAFVDAILTATGASRIFTQDIEEMNGGILEPDKPEEDPIKTANNPLVDAVMAAGGEIIPDFKKLNKKYGVNLDFCWHPDHANADWRDNKFGKSHKVGDGWCNFKNLLKPIATEISKIKGWELSAMNEEIKKKYDGRTWSKLTDYELAEFLESLISE